MVKFFSVKKGYTFIELILVVTIVAILAGLSIPFGSSFLTRAYLQNKTNELVSSLRISQLNARSGKEADSWGVTIDGDKIILFKGSSYLSPGTDFDQSFTIPKAISISAGETVFSFPGGGASGTAQYTITGPTGSRVVEISQEGVVSVQ